MEASARLHYENSFYKLSAEKTLFKVSTTHASVVTSSIFRQYMQMFFVRGKNRRQTPIIPQ